MRARRVDAEGLARVLLLTGLLVLVPPIALRQPEQWSLVPPWWSVVAVGLLVAAGVAAARRDVVTSARLLWVFSFGASLTLPDLLAADLDDPHWAAGVVFTSATAACLVSSRTLVSLAAAALLVVAHVHLSVRSSWEIPDDRLVGDVVYVVVLALIGQILWAVMRRAERDVVEARGGAVRALASARDHEARVRAANRWDALIHDRVLSALTATSAGVAEAPAEARRALDQLVSGPPPVPALTDGVLEATLELHPSTATGFTVAPDAVALPETVRLALVEATSEALRNVARHAWTGAPGESRLTVDHDELSARVTLRDFGRGFDPSRVPAGRLGLAVSVRERMRAVGGDATVRSSPGRGTRVDLVWPRP